MKLNRKMYRAAMRSILSELARQGRLVVVESIAVDEPRTRLLSKQLADFALDNVLIIADEVDRNLYLAARNIPRVDVRDATGVDPVSLVSFEKILVTVPALRKFEEMLG